jgi:hypothetical protein
MTSAENPVGQNNGPCHVSGIFLPLRVNSLPLATIYEVKIPLRKWKKSLLQRNPAQMTWHIVSFAQDFFFYFNHIKASNITNLDFWEQGRDYYC